MCTELNADRYRNCTLCPRLCGADRSTGAQGVCGMDATLRAARASLHLWEEPCLTGKNGSGTVFFTGCPLGCVYCQNRDISANGVGVSMTPEALAHTFLTLQEKGAANINLVTATPYLPDVVAALIIAEKAGMTLPVVYNTSGYERVETLRALDGLIDIYLPDFKSLSAKRSALYMNAPDYPTVAQAAIDEMVRQCGVPTFDEDGIMTRGVIVRHLILPGGEGDARHVLRRLATYGDRIYVSLMSQYTPMPGLESYPELMRRVSPLVYKHLTEEVWLRGIGQLYTQEGESASESFIPAFDGSGLCRM